MWTFSPLIHLLLLLGLVLNNNHLIRYSSLVFGTQLSNYPGGEEAERCPGVCFCSSSTEGMVSCSGDGRRSDLPPITVLPIKRLELTNFNFTSTFSPSPGASHLYPYILFGDPKSDLKELTLRGNQIANFSREVLINVSTLVRLDLSRNLMASLPPLVFSALGATLESLDLSSNSLTTVEGILANLSSLLRLNLNNNMLTELNSRDFGDSKKLILLALDSNRIKEIDGETFLQMDCLRKLFLANNPLLEPGVGGDRKGVPGAGAGNGTSSITESLRVAVFPRKLQFLEVSNTSTKGGIPGGAVTCQNLLELRVTRNRMERVEEGDFEGFLVLRVLVLSFNLIEDVEEDALGRLPSLMVLDLEGNRLKRIPFNLPPSLRHLSLGGNQIENVREVNFWGLVRLEVLDLKGNRIKSIAACAFCRLLALKSLNLKVNPVENLTREAIRSFSNRTDFEQLVSF